MIESIQQGKDIYASIAALAFNKPYEECLEFHPETHEYQPDGKARRTEAKSVVLGISYGRSTVTVGEQLFGHEDITPEEMTKKAQAVYDAVFAAFPNLKSFMDQTQAFARHNGYVETFLGTRRHIPDMQLKPFEFEPMRGYINPDIDPLDVSALEDSDKIPQKKIRALEAEFAKMKYFGQIVKRTKELYEENIKVINNTQKITEATRQCVNSVIQGSAAMLTKMAILRLESNQRWKEIGGRFIIPVHDELICEVPIEHAEEGAKILSNCMEESGAFMELNLSCDVEMTYAWYGLEAPCPYPKPSQFTDIEALTEDEIKWVQYMLHSTEYHLPVYKDAEGNKPRGDAAYGVNGIWSKEVEEFIFDFCKLKRVPFDQFCDAVERRVVKGE